MADSICCGVAPSMAAYVAAEANLDLQVAYYRIVEARAQLGIAEGDLLPSLTAGGSFTRQKLSDNSFLGQQIGGSVPANSEWSIGLSSFWELDLFGRIRRNIEASSALFEATICTSGIRVTSLGLVIRFFQPTQRSQCTNPIGELRREFRTIVAQPFDRHFFAQPARLLPLDHEVVKLPFFENITNHRAPRVIGLAMRRTTEPALDTSAAGRSARTRSTSPQSLFAEARRTKPN